MLKILITGIAGFIGSNLADRLLLKKNCEVIGIDNLSAGVLEQIPPGAKFYKLDIRSKEIYPLFEGIDFVFHLAAKNCVADCQSDPVEAASINSVGSMNVFEAASRAKVQKIIFAETSALYEGSSLLPTPESELEPKSFYAVSKAPLLSFAKAYHQFHNLSFTSLRYFNVYGPRQDYRRTIPPAMCAFILNLLQNKKPTIFGSGKKRRDFIYIDDINDFHLLCLKDSRTDNKVFNLGSAKNYSVLEILDLIQSLLKTDIKPSYQKDLPFEAQETLADIFIAKQLGWRPKVSLEEGLKKTIQYIKKYALQN